MKLIYATRKSMLALAQSKATVDAILKLNNQLEMDVLHVVSTGDKILNQSLQDVGGKGLFIKELEEAMVEGKADFAVHSLKDVPYELPAGFTIACIPAREDPRDALISKGNISLKNLHKGARIGTSSLRRSVLLKRYRPDLEIISLRGNVDTRIRKLNEGQFDAIVLALAGLKRLNLDSQVSEILDPNLCLPAIGQGALAIECLEKREDVISVLKTFEDSDTTIAVSIERSIMKELDGSCHLPIGAYAIRVEQDVLVQAFVSNPDGSDFRSLKKKSTWPSSLIEAKQLGHELGRVLK